MNQIQWTLNTMPKSDDRYLTLMSKANVDQARAFFKTFPQYAVTPLARLDNMAGRLGLGGLFVKDESYRFGLNAFKVLGGAFAMARYIAEQTNQAIEAMTYDYLTGDRLRRDFGQATFFTATDGNHGRGVAWAAHQLGQKAVVHMPKGSAQMRFDNIAKEGAAAGQLAGRPTHVFLQAGVGCMASAVVGYYANLYPEAPPKFVIIEAESAACLYLGACQRDGSPAIVDGDMPTIMAGLACGEPNLLGWDILRNHADAFLACPDWVSARGMRMLAAPMTGDPAVVSGESGAVGMGVIDALMTDPAYGELKEALGLGEDSRVLLFSTEGNTDPENYRRIVWGGAYPTPEA